MNARDLSTLAALALASLIGGCDTVAFNDYSCSGFQRCDVSSDCGASVCRCVDGTTTKQQSSCVSGCCSSPERACVPDCEDHGGWDHDFVDGLLGGGDVSDGGTVPGTGCTPASEAIATGVTPGTDLVVAQGAAYFYDGNDLMRATGTGSASIVTTLSGAQPTVAASTTKLFVGGGGGVSSLPLAGGAKTMLAKAVDVVALATFGDQVLYGDFTTPGKIYKVPQAGGTPTAITDGVATNLATNGSFVGWVEAVSGKVPTLSVAKLDGTGKRQVASGKSLLNIAMDATHVYWADADAGGLFRAALAGGAAQQVIAMTPYPQTSIAIDDGFVYVVDRGANASCEYGKVLKVPKAGGTRTVVAVEATPFALAVDATHVWFTVLEGVRRAKK